METLKVVLKPVANILLLEGVFMLISGMVDFFDGNISYLAFFFSFAINILFAMFCFFASIGASSIRSRDSIVLLPLSWIICIPFGMIPLLINSPQMPASMAMFEIMSAITTTSASILEMYGPISRGTFLLHTLLTSIGGVGVVVIYFLVMESTDSGTGLDGLARKDFSNEYAMNPFMTKNIVLKIISIYVGFGILASLFYRLCGLSWFDGISTGVATIATSGFVHSGNFLQIFDNDIKMLGGIFFMLLSGLPLVFVLNIIERRTWNIFRTEQVAWFLGIVVFTILADTILSLRYQISVTSFIKMSFSVVSSITTTGFGLSKEVFYHNGIIAGIFCLTVLGGCVGSTAGGIKVGRFVVLLKSIWHHLNKRASPHSVMAIRFGGNIVSNAFVNETLLLISSYVLTAFIGVVVTTALVNCTMSEASNWVISLLTTSGLSSPAFMLSKISNSVIRDAFSIFSSVLMLIGRVELFTIYGLFSSKLWSR